MIQGSESLYDVVVVGGGAAGIGVAVALKQAGIENFVVLERHQVGASFSQWPEETRFITPSFPTNSIGMLDLNSVAIGVSPAYSLRNEHPTGREYADLLCRMASFFEIPVREHIEVEEVRLAGDEFNIVTSTAPVHTRNVIWAGGEYQYPRIKGLIGGELCQHTSTIRSYRELEGDDFIVIGGYESGIDAAYHLASYGKQVRLFDKGCPWESDNPDPSISLSPFSIERMRASCFTQRVTLYPYSPVFSVAADETVYQVATRQGEIFETRVPPLFAGGFEGSHLWVADLFEPRDDGFPLLTENDESTLVPGLYFAGPSVRHENQVFCFIYKYRQRFAVVAKAIASSLGLPADELETYRNWGMYLDDLSCCGEDCVC